jgi:hypothetical protein
MKITLTRQNQGVATKEYGEEDVLWLDQIRG